MSIRRSHRKATAKESRLSGERRLTNFLKVEALLFDPETETYWVRLVFDDVQYRRHRVDMPLHEFHSGPYLSKLLVGRGYLLPSDPTARKQLLTGIRNAKPETHATIVHKTGWHNDVFVTGTEVIGNGQDAIVFKPRQSDPIIASSVRGSLQDWKRHVAEPAAASSIMMFVALLALSAPVLRFTSVGNRAYHLFGPSSTGKSKTFLIGKSVIGPATSADLPDLNTTKAGLEELLAANNDSLVCLDEVGHLKDADATKILKDLAFTVGGGHTRRRSRTWNPGTDRVETFNVIAVTNGEHGLDHYLSDRLAGERVRFIDLPAHVDEELGVFESLPPGCATSYDAIKSIEEACKKQYGAALRSWIAVVQANQKVIVNRVKRLMNAFMTSLELPDVGWERRFAEPFALAYAVGLVTTVEDILPWRAPHIRKAVEACYRAARMAARSPDEQLSAGIRRLRGRLKGLQRNGLIVPRSQAKEIPEAERQRIQAYKVRDHHGDYYAIGKECFDRWFETHAQAKLVVDELAKRGQLIHSEKRTRQVTIPGEKQRHRYICIRKGWDDVVRLDRSGSVSDLPA